MKNVEATFGVGRLLGAAVVMALWLAAPAAHALINPRFTPVQLVKESSLILSVDVKQGTSNTNYVLTVREVLKGKTEDKAINLDLSKARDDASAEMLRKLASAGGPALFFVGTFQGDGGMAEKRGLLHIQGQWGSCVVTEKGEWLYDNLDQGFQAVWNGGSDMLRRAVDYVQGDEEAYVPVSDGISWSPDPLKVATLDGSIKSVRTVDLLDDGKLVLFVARDKGDQLFSCEKGARKLTNITADRGLQSKSLVYAWGCFGGQKRLDLVSYDGKSVTLSAQQADGKFKSSPLDLGKTLEGGCISLTALDVGSPDRAGLVVGGNGLPVLVALDAEGKATCTGLAAPGIDLAKLGKAGVCLVADFDGDSFADVLAVRQEGSILFRGEAPGKFKPGVASAVKCGDAVAGVCVGDFDGDGCLDVLVAGGTTRFMWHNDGKGSFAERFSAVGEMMTHDQIVKGADCMVGDVNNDGRQDILLAYANASPVTYFARGFLSYGHSHTIDINENNLLPDANNARDGAQSACLADVDGDGAQDLVLALSNGDVWILFRGNDQQESRAVMAVLPVSGSAKGPVKVTGWIGKRCLGAWNVQPGSGPAWFGREDSGAVTMKWCLPGGKEYSPKPEMLMKGGVKKVVVSGQ